MFYYKNWSPGFIQAIIKLYELPPIDCFRMDVSFESQYGTWTFYFPLPLLASERILITWRNVNNDLLMSILSFANRPYVPVIQILYDPAKSTNSNLLNNAWLGLSFVKLSILIVIIEWLLEDCIFSLCAELILFFSPYKKNFISSYWFLYSNTNKFYTLNCSSLFHLKRNPFMLDERFYFSRRRGWAGRIFFSCKFVGKRLRLKMCVCDGKTILCETGP